MTKKCRTSHLNGGNKYMHKRSGKRLPGGEALPGNTAEGSYKGKAHFLIERKLGKMRRTEINSLWRQR